jgi:hypothetical protein
MMAAAEKSINHAWNELTFSPETRMRVQCRFIERNMIARVIRCVQIGLLKQKESRFKDFIADARCDVQ